MLVPTLVYAAVALRWAIDQFQREDVLFREAEQFSLSAWFRHLLRDREPMPTGGQAALCFALILTSTWFLMHYLMLRGADLRSGQRGRRSVDHLDSPGDHGVPAHVGPEENVAAGVARAALPRAWPWRWCVALNPLVNELRPLVESLFPISSIDQDVAGPDHVPGAGAGEPRFSSSP